MLRVFATLCLLASSVAGAQSLEQSYASLCGGAKKSSETCAALRQALMDKLAKDSSAAPAQSLTSTPAAPPPRAKKMVAIKKGVVSPRWGFWAKLAGATTADASDGSIRSYAWLEKGAVLELERLARDERGTSRFRLLEDGDILVERDGAASYRMEPAENATFVATQGGERWRYSFAAKKLTVAQEQLVLGAWKPTGTVQTRRILAASEIASAKSKINAQRVAFASEVKEKWGALGTLVGHVFGYEAPGDPSGDSIATWNWLEAGKTAEFKWVKLGDGKTTARMVVTRDPATGTLSSVNHLNRNANVLIDGPVARFVYAAGVAGKYQVVDEHRLADGKLRIDNYTLKKGKQRDLTTSAFPDVSARSASQISAAHQQRVAAYKAGQQKQATVQQAQASAPKKKGGGGLFGALGGAMLGAMAGGDTSQILGAAAKGAAMVDPTSASAGALNTIGDTMITGGNGGGALDTALGSAVSGGSSGAASSASASGHPYPNLAEGSCGSLMNLQNYRTNALSGGNDVQLKTLCGQAYEYYAMYKRAITQGYGHDDLMRTYNAHKDASAVVNQFYREAR